MSYEAIAKPHVLSGREMERVGTGPGGVDGFWLKGNCFGEIEANAAARRGRNELQFTEK